MSDWSRHTRYSQRKPLYGEREDRGVWYRCWVCGFQRDSSRTPLGGANQPNNIPQHIAEVVNQYHDSFSGDPNNAVLAFGNGIPLMETGVSITGYNYPYVSDGSGCPFCFTLNWR